MSTRATDTTRTSVSRVPYTIGDAVKKPAVAVRAVGR